MSVATAAASAISGSGNNNNINAGAFGGILGSTKQVDYSQKHKKENSKEKLQRKQDLQEPLLVKLWA